MTGEIAVSREDMMPRLRACLTRSGYPLRLSEVSPDVMALAREIYLEAMDLARPAVLTLELSSEDVPAHLLPDALTGATSYNMILISIGSLLPERVAEYFGMEEPLKAVLLDSWGSESVEAVAHNVDRRLRAEKGEGSMRFAPGYGGFDVRKNVDWLEIMRKRSASSLDVAADPSTGILTPVKSILCMIGWGKRAE